METTRIFYRPPGSPAGPHSYDRRLHNTAPIWYSVRDKRIIYQGKHRSPSPSSEFRTLHELEQYLVEVAQVGETQPLNHDLDFEDGF